MRQPGLARRPFANRGLIRRPDLFARLSSAEPGGVVLVCAAAGSGKSILVRSWVETAGLQDHLAWLSVERVERDAQRFWVSLVDAVARTAESVEPVAPAPGFNGEQAVARLLSGLNSLTDPLILVIDDLHELRSAEALEWLEQLLTRLPPQLLVVLVSREDPRLGLHRLRLAGVLTEIRELDLRFSLDETRQLLAREGMTMSDAGVALLHERTEGWVAGLRLAVLSLARSSDPERFVREFSGSERTVAGYLMSEVLERQPADVRELLLRTSILEGVSGELADFLTGGTGAERMLQQLEDENAFVSALDASRSWFRYHHLFADLLQLELRRVAPGSVIPLHRAAAEWFELHGSIIDAVRHAQMSRDWPRASRLLSDHYFDLALDGRVGTVRTLLYRFPDDAIADPELAVAFSAVYLLEGQLDETAAYLDSARGSADAVAPERRHRFDAHLAAMTLVLARWRGDLSTVLEAIRALDAALAALPPGERSLTRSHRAVALQNLGVAELWSLRLDDSRLHLAQALSLARRAGYRWLEIAPLAHLAIVDILLGQPIRECLRESEEAIRIVETHNWGGDPITVTPLAASAVALTWLGRLDEAAARVGRAEQLLQPGGEPGTETIVHYARGLLWLAENCPEQALNAFCAADRARALLAGDHALTVELRSRMIRAQIALGSVAAARGALDVATDEDRDQGEMRVAAATLLLAEGEPAQAQDVLTPVIQHTATSLHPLLSGIEASLLDAAAREQLRDHRGAEQSVERALDLAEPEGVILPFLLADVSDLLGRHPRHRTTHATLLRTILAARAGSSAPARNDPAPLTEPLSDSEMRVVRYLPSNLKAPEIAAELFVSTNTVRTHIRHIYAKLGAHDREAAVGRARELGLIAPSLRSK